MCQSRFGSIRKIKGQEKNEDPQKSVSGLHPLGSWNSEIRLKLRQLSQVAARLENEAESSGLPCPQALGIRL